MTKITVKRGDVGFSAVAYNTFTGDQYKIVPAGDDQDVVGAVDDGNQLIVTVDDDTTLSVDVDGDVRITHRGIGGGDLESMDSEARDGGSLSLKKGESAVFSALPTGVSAPSAVAAQDEVVEDEVKAAGDDKGGAVVDATDEQVNEVLALQNANADAKRTQTGYLDLKGINAALAEKNLSPITADRRTALSDAGNFVGAPKAGEDDGV